MSKASIQATLIVASAFLTFFLAVAGMHMSEGSFRMDHKGAVQHLSAARR